MISVSYRCPKNRQSHSIKDQKGQFSTPLFMQTFAFRETLYIVDPGYKIPFLTMKQRLAHIAIVVADYDEAIKFYTEKLHFDLIEDTILSETKRWVLVAPKGGEDSCRLLLAKAANEEQRSRVGNQTGGRVFLFLHTDDFGRDYQNLIDQKIKIVREPAKEAWGTVAVFEDLYGNLWDLIQPV
jgi:catechol 2,3-dioxygenase-like lactoylglutathione lyase family enzyme